MKTRPKLTLLVACVFAAPIRALDTQNERSVKAEETRIVELKSRQAALRAKDGGAQETQFKSATAAVQRDPELSRLRSELALLHNAKRPAPERAKRVEQLNEELLQKQHAKILALHPELKDYLAAKEARKPIARKSRPCSKPTRMIRRRGRRFCRRSGSEGVEELKS
ncbi:MAG: hypothetical protein AB1705_24000 [Verrucomicrobiota bacterium]